jgi:hypothetical protein
MKNALRIVLVMVMSYTLILATGCAPKIKYSGFLQDYPEFEKGKKGGVRLVYLKKGVDFKAYDKVMVDHVVFYFSKDSKYKGINSDELSKLADAFHKAMADALKGGYPMVKEPGPGVLRIRFAITDIKASRPILNTISTVMPIGLGISIVKRGLTGTHSNVGGASMEVEFLDSQANERVAAAIDRRAAGKTRVIKGMTKWGHAKGVFGFWAKRLRRWLDEVHEQ